MTFWILTQDTDEIIARSAIRSAENKQVNLRNTFDEYVAGKNDEKGRFDSLTNEISKARKTKTGINIDPSDLLGYSFAHERDDGIKQRATVVEIDNENNLFTLEYITGDRDLIDYNQLINSFNAQDEDGDRLWSFKGIKDHRKKGRGYEVLVDWDHCNASWESLDHMKSADLFTLAKYAHDQGLVDEHGWKWAKKLYKNPKKYIRMTKIFRSQVKDMQARFKFGVEIPRTFEDAERLDKENGNTKWADARAKEMEALTEYKTFTVLKPGEKAPKEYRRIPGFFIYDVKHDLRRKARFVAGGHVTKPPKEETYSGVVDHESVRLTLFVAEMNNLQVRAADIGNAYLHATTRERVFIVAGPEFGPELEGRILIIVKSLYGLKSSAARWHEELAQTLREMGFEPSKADFDLWIKDCETHYEYICVYVDDIIAASLNADALLEEFRVRAHYKLKGVGQPAYYLGGNYGRVKVADGMETCYLSASTYIENICTKIEKVMKVTLKNYQMPMDPEYRPEVDSSTILSENLIAKYRMLVGSALWAATLGRYDILYATNTFARYNILPREGHLNGMLRVFGYLKTFKKAKLVFDYRDFTHDSVEEIQHSWGELYPNAKEELPNDMPVPKMKTVKITSIYDASHAPCLVTRRSVTGIVLLLNNFLLRCTSKRQNTVETSTYGAEMVAGRLAVEQVMDVRYKLRMLGVPVEGASALLGDNQSVITSCSLPSSHLKKKHNAIAYHRIREAVAAGIVKLFYINTKYNLADALTKALPGNVHYNLWKSYLLKPLQEKGEYQHMSYV